MILAVNIFLWAMAAMVVAPVVVFCVECLASLGGARRRNISPETTPRFAVIIPAHNEASVIDATLKVLTPTLGERARAVVVADNCTDNTAEIARKWNVEVVERTHETKRGKGFALDCGVQHLKTDPPDVVVILDADCLVMEDAAPLLAAAAYELQQPVQGLNLSDRSDAIGSTQVVATLANRVMNLVRPLGLSRLGLPCRLLGTGMALPFDLAASAELANGNLVEDMQLGIDLLIAGHATAFVPQARITTNLPPQDKAFLTQRKRWEHGHFHTMFTQCPRLIVNAIRDFRFGPLTLALDLMVPPLAFLVLVLVLALMVSGVAAVLGGSWLPLAVIAAACGLFAAAVFTAWWAHCRHQVRLTALLSIPVYMLRKIPIYTSMLLNRQGSWVRTQRQNEGAG